MRMGAVLLLVALALPLVIGNNYQLGIAHQALILVLLASGYNLLLGFTGLVSFGHIALFAIGAYTSAILVVSFGLPFLVGLVAAAVLTGVVGVLIAVPALRIKGHYLTLLTLALGEVIRLADGEKRTYPPVAPDIQVMIQEGGMRGMLAAHLRDHPELAIAP